MYQIPSIGVRTDVLTATGISSGAFNSMKMHLIDPATFKGVGMIVGGPPALRTANQLDYSNLPYDLDFDKYMSDLRERESKG